MAFATGLSRVVHHRHTRSMTVTAYIGATVFLTVLLFRYCLHYKWGTCKSMRNMWGKTVIVTGANSGLGKVTARELAKRGAKVILACRDLPSAAKAVKDIRRVTANGELVIKHLDLASQLSVRRFAEDVIQTERALDGLINNAGICQCPFLRTAEGYELQFGVNHLGHFLLTNLLLNLLKATPSSRIVIVTSHHYKSGKLDFSRLNDQSAYDKKAAYCNSKLANVLFGRELAKRTAGLGMDVFMVSPGMVWTNLSRHLSLSIWEKLALAVFGIAFIRTPLQGCQTILHCTISEEVQGKSGTYYRNCRECPHFPNALDDKLAAGLWELSEKMSSL